MRPRVAAKSGCTLGEMHTPTAAMQTSTMLREMIQVIRTIPRTAVPLEFGLLVVLQSEQVDGVTRILQGMYGNGHLTRRLRIWPPQRATTPTRRRMRIKVEWFAVEG